MYALIPEYYNDQSVKTNVDNIFIVYTYDLYQMY